ncbi:MAG: hypothetical protein KAW12_27630 [Candidatus Aminicenantes bacterium]|nr:hypothetical protein [Candidatus Aminicenantes bacterium]
MKKNSRGFFSLTLLATLLMVCMSVPGPAQFGSIGKAAGPEFLVYTFKADPTVKIGYPKGWSVQETQLGAVITENQTNDSAGILFFIVQLQQGVNTNDDLAKTMIAGLQQQFPDLKPAARQPHPQAPEVLTIDATLSSEGIPFRAHMWCVANAQNRLGLFIVFYAPTARYGSFDANQYLTAAVKPMFEAGK